MARAVHGRGAPQAALLVAILAAAVRVAVALRGPAGCPQGCIIATANQPRACACVLDPCSAPPPASAPVPAGPSGARGATMAAAASAAAAAGKAPGVAAALAARAAVAAAKAATSGPGADAAPRECFCDEGYNTYATFDECLAGTTAFEPSGPRAPRRAPLSLLDDQAAAVVVEAAAQRGNGGGHGDIARGGYGGGGGGGGGGGSRRLLQGGSCPWPILPPAEAGVPKTACPVGAVAAGRGLRFGAFLVRQGYATPPGKAPPSAPERAQPQAARTGRRCRHAP
jgi:hypothetical protein